MASVVQAGLDTAPSIPTQSSFQKGLEKAKNVALKVTKVAIAVLASFVVQVALASILAYAIAKMSQLVFISAGAYTILQHRMGIHTKELFDKLSPVSVYDTTYNFLDRYINTV